MTWQDTARAQEVLRGDEQAILHLHGFWQEPGSVVLGVRSYEQLLGAEHAQAMQQAMTAMGTLLFVGFGAGLADPNFAALRAWMAWLFKGSEYRHFRLAMDGEVAGLQAEHGQDERVLVLGYGPSHADLAPYLRRLAPGPAAACCRRSGSAAADTAAGPRRTAAGVERALCRQPELHRPDRHPRRAAGWAVPGAGDGAPAGDRAPAGWARPSWPMEYAWRHRADYDAVWWVRAETAASLHGDYAALAPRPG